MTGIKLEAGKTYLDRKGEKHGPLVRDLKRVGTRREYSLDGCGLVCAWRADGRFYNSGESPLDLIEEVVKAKTTMRDYPDHNDKNAVPDYNDGTIHGWNGGDCPVHSETVVKVWFDLAMPCESRAGEFDWSISPPDCTHDYDITAFRVVKEYVEPKVIWVNEYADGTCWAGLDEETAKMCAAKDATRIAVKYVEAIADAKECKE